MSLVLLRYLTSNLIVKGLDNLQCPHLSTNGGFTSSFGPSSDVLPQAVLEFNLTVFCTSVRNVETNNFVKGQLRIIPRKDEVFNISNTELFSETLLFKKR